ncbi:hypothetical protein [Halodesulfovibrio spirochaetisodalis]|uniref:Uncharacterized protein n=1 Tax=Halodesulfovibrio spirochaetisodalis TaxID=1560234 RepID=A0A1B7XA40_9BACT|nr:hypothetical protein [Halodesulfovibrio spirochaetisodalis]OBQ46241.1 hypothetical protein SP90_13675 [Halodesulfovibrio spirochaetisodalis]
MPVVICPSCKTEHFVRSKKGNKLCKKCCAAAISKKKKAKPRKPPRKGKMVPCERCGTEFYQHVSRLESGNGKFCSKKCAYAAKKEAKRIANTVNCPWCDKVFVKRSEQTYCSRSCAAAAVHARNNSADKKTAKRTCIVCEKEFTLGVSNRICSHACLVQHRKELGCHPTKYALESDPWETGAIPPDRFARDMFRQPDPVLGF